MNVVTPSLLEAAIAYWRSHEFYASAVVLGLDIGLEGLGVCVRRGPEIVYAKTWQYDVPEAARLADRRAKRAWRHCRANRQTRLHRLALLMEKHGLPDMEKQPEVLRRTDPYEQRRRGAQKKLGSKQALSIAIRHCVAHRGYDYEYFSDEGRFPWGDTTEHGKVLKELNQMWLTPEDAAKGRADAATFEDWSPEHQAEFDRILTLRTAGPEKILERLALHAKGEQNHRRMRAKGEAFPRKLVWAHLEQIIQHNAEWIENPAEFFSALGVNPKLGGDKTKAIFYYHRKTPEEMRRHFEKKKARCPYASHLGVPEAIVARGDDLDVRRFRLLEFAATRDVELHRKRGKGLTPEVLKVPLGANFTQRLLAWIEANPDKRMAKDAADITADLCAELADTHKAKVAPMSGKTPSKLNEWFFKILRDLLAPGGANRNQNASMCAATARKLFATATAQGYSREAVKASLEDFYNLRRSVSVDLYGVYPQVEYLLGQRVKKARSRHGKNRGDLAHDGRLQRLFAQLAPRLGGATVPDYCVVEIARDLPRTQKQKKEREDHIAENEERRKKLFAKYGVDEDGKKSKRLYVELHDQQRGICPFTGKDLPHPLDDSLEIEHLYPETLGGLTVNDNLVLTFKSVNATKGKRTPRQAAGDVGVPFDEMLKFTVAMRWSAFKREVFAWETPDVIPPFGNTTRTAQLAKQLEAEITRWLGCEHTPDEAARRIGRPTGFFTAACRRAWALPLKDRTDLTHHLVDAVILAHIPPREGQNYVFSRGLFYPRWEAEKRREILDVLPLGPGPATVAALVAPDAAECPVEKHRPASHRRSLHDQTLWRVGANGTLRQRQPLPAKDTLDPIGLRKLLTDSGIPETYRRKDGTEAALIPGNEALDRWLQSKTDEPLRLRNGTPVRAVWKTSEKGSLKDDPTGFHAEWNENGELSAIKAIDGRWEALELWRAWDAKKKRWGYVKRLRPAPAVLRSLRSLGISWDKPSKRPWRNGADPLPASLKKRLTGALPPHAFPALHRAGGPPVRLRVGDVFRAGFSAAGKLVKRGETPTRFEWVALTAVMAAGGGRLRFKKHLLKDTWKEEPMSADDLAHIAGLPPADDPSSYPTQRAPGPARPDGPTDLRLE